MPDKQGKNRGESTRWQKGQSGNPAGRPRKEDCITSVLKEQLAEVKPRDPHKRTWAQCVVAALLRAATAGNVRAAGLILERTEGKIKESLQVEPQEVVFRWATNDDDLSENRWLEEGINEQ